MFNISEISYSNDCKNLYFILGVAGASFVSFSEVDYQNPDLLNISFSKLESLDAEDSLLTKHALELSEASLREDWDSQEDEHWKSFL